MPRPFDWARTVATYDEATRRRRAEATRRARGYMERGTGRGIKRRAVLVGPAVMERIVGGRYEWRAAGYKARRKR